MKLAAGMYFTDDPVVAGIYAAMRGTADDPKIILVAEVTAKELGRVLDLIDGPHAKRWAELVQQVGEKGLVNERYHNLLSGFLKEIGSTRDDFDTIIGREYIRGGKQINVRTNTIQDQILKQSKEIHQ